MLDKLMQFVRVTSKTNQPQELEEIIGFYITKNKETGAEKLGGLRIRYQTGASGFDTESPAQVAGRKVERYRRPRGGE